MKYKIITAKYKKAQKIALKLRTLLIDHTENNYDFEYLFLIGGDGTFAKEVCKNAFVENLKIIGINGGNIGFFSMFSENNLNEILTIIDSKKIYETCYKVCHLIKVELNQKKLYGFNDLVVYAKNLLTFNVSIDDYFFEHYRGSGLLFSTKYGSTGYNKSANGPVMFPQVHGLIMTELFPQATSEIHTIKNSIILPHQSCITLVPNDDYRKFRLSLDGIELNEKIVFEKIKVSLVESKALFYFACDTKTYIQKLQSIFLKPH